MPRLGLKLYIRKFKNIFIRKLGLFLKANGGIIALISTVITIFYAYKTYNISQESVKLQKHSNKLSEIAINLAKNDSFQQTQIDHLGKILEALKDQNISQNDLINNSQSQINELSKIVELNRKQTDITNDNLSEIKKTSELIYKLLMLGQEEKLRRNITDSIAFIDSKRKLLNIINESHDSVSIFKEMVFRNGDEIKFDSIYIRTKNLLYKIHSMFSNEYSNTVLKRNLQLQEKWNNVIFEIRDLLYIAQIYTPSSEERSNTYKLVNKFAREFGEIHELIKSTEFTPSVINK